MNASPLEKSAWISSGAHIVNFGNDYPKNAFMFRRKLRLRDGGGRFLVYLAGLGFHELYVNGERVGDSYLEPAFSAYDKTVYYNVYDVSGLVRAGENVFGVLLGNGWYNQNARDVWNFYSAPWREMPKLAFCLCGDGKPLLRSDGRWKANGDGPIVFNDLRQGEYYDARKEGHFFAADYDDSLWASAEICAPPGGRLKKQEMPAVKIVEERRPRSVVRQGGKFLVDFGANLAGCVRICMRGARGRELVIRYGETLDGEGNLDTEKTSRYLESGASQTDRYIFKGEGTEIWHARFVYHGFRYAEISGADSLPEGGVTALFMRTGFERIGRFSCSDPLFEKIFCAGVRSFECNYHSIPTDCPHREKNGWTGDAQLSCEQSVKNFDMLSSYKKWLGDLTDAQRLTGQLPGIAPTSGWGYNWGSGPAWDVALFELPHQCYLHYGDTDIVKQTYPAAKKYERYMRSRMRGGLAMYGLGDWCAPTRAEGFVLCDNRLSDSVYCCYMTRILAEMAEVCGDARAARVYEGRAEKIRSAIRKAYLCDETSLKSMTALSMFLHYGIVNDGEERARYAAMLDACVRENGYGMLVGILGAKCVLNALAENGYAETAVKMLENTEYPSYGHWIENGATTFHEDWESSFSLNHHMFSDVVAWMYKYIAGLKPLLPGFCEFSVAPLCTEYVREAETEYVCPYGKIFVSYRKAEKFVIRVRVPQGTVCRLKMPSGKEKRLSEGEYEFSE